MIRAAGVMPASEAAAHGSTRPIRYETVGETGTREDSAGRDSGSGRTPPPESIVLPGLSIVLYLRIGKKVSGARRIK